MTCSSQAGCSGGSVKSLYHIFLRLSSPGCLSRVVSFGLSVLGYLSRVVSFGISLQGCFSLAVCPGLSVQCYIFCTKCLRLSLLGFLSWDACSEVSSIGGVIILGGSWNATVSNPEKYSKQNIQLLNSCEHISVHLICVNYSDASIKMLVVLWYWCLTISVTQSVPSVTFVIYWPQNDIRQMLQLGYHRVLRMYANCDSISCHLWLFDGAFIATMLRRTQDLFSVVTPLFYEIVASVLGFLSSLTYSVLLWPRKIPFKITLAW